MAPPTNIRASLVAAAEELGLSALGVASVAADLRADYYQRWIAQGQHGDMAWMDNPKRTDIQTVQPGCRSIVVAGLNYYQATPRNVSPPGVAIPQGRVATYALGRDYHKVLLTKMQQLATQMATWGGEQKAYVDTGPILEKRFAAATQVGWQGKNTMVISEKYGNWLNLGVILTTLDIPSDTPHADRCGSCTRCMAACPTGAITAPYQLDARRCIAYLTIEHKEAISLEYRQAIGDRLFGCEECLTVCPWNRWAVQTKEADYKARDYPTARQILQLSEEDFAQIFSGTPIKRLGLRRLQRNACIVLGNTAGVEVHAELEAFAVAHAADEMLAEVAAWAIGQIKKGGGATPDTTPPHIKYPD